MSLSTSPALLSHDVMRRTYVSSYVSTEPRHRLSVLVTPAMNAGLSLSSLNIRSGRQKTDCFGARDPGEQHEAISSPDVVEMPRPRRRRVHPSWNSKRVSQHH